MREAPDRQPLLELTARLEAERTQTLDRVRAAEAPTVEVQVLGATSGQVVVSGLADGDELVANPAAARGIVRC